MPRVVFDPLAKAHLIEHLEVEARALLEALGFEKLSFFEKFRATLLQFDLDRFDCAQDFFARRHVVARRVDDEAVHLLFDPPGERIKEKNRVDFVVKELHPHGALGVFGREDVDRVAPHAEGSAHELGVGAAVLHANELRDELPLRAGVSAPENAAHFRVAFGRADAVDGGNRRHDDRVAALENRLCRRETHLLDVLVHRRVLFDEEVARGHVGLGLIEVVVGDEVLDGVLREELAHFRIGLRGERLVRREDDGGHARSGDDVGHRIGLPRPRHAE